MDAVKKSAIEKAIEAAIGTNGIVPLGPKDHINPSTGQIIGKRLGESAVVNISDERLAKAVVEGLTELKGKNDYFTVHGLHVIACTPSTFKAGEYGIVITKPMTSTALRGEDALAWLNTPTRIERVESTVMAGKDDLPY